MEALQFMVTGLVCMLLLAMHLWFKGYKKLGLVLRDFTFGAGLFYGILVLVIGLGG